MQENGQKDRMKASSLFKSKAGSILQDSLLPRLRSAQHRRSSSAFAARAKAASPSSAPCCRPLIVPGLPISLRVVRASWVLPGCSLIFILFLHCPWLKRSSLYLFIYLFRLRGIRIKDEPKQTPKLWFLLLSGNQLCPTLYLVPTLRSNEPLHLSPSELPSWELRPISNKIILRFFYIYREEKEYNPLE